MNIKHIKYRYLFFLFISLSCFSQSENEIITLDNISPNISKLFFDYQLDSFQELEILIRMYSEPPRDPVSDFCKLYYETLIYLDKHDQGVFGDTGLERINFQTLHNNAKINLLKSKTHLLEGFYHEYFFSNYNKSEYHYEKAIELINKDQTISVKNWFNLGVFLKNVKKFEAAKSFFLNGQSQFFSYDANIYYYKSCEGLYLCYKDLKIADSALHYFEKMQKIKSDLSESELNQLLDNSEKIYIKLSSFEENQNIKKRNKTLKKSFFEVQNDFQIILSLLGGAFILIIIIFYLYKRYKKKSVILEEEQSETLQRLDELKSIVIKNHIILKDKTKVYISDLIYIKSDDHYLEVFMQDGKSHIVRGKLSQVKEELPPNFIQCHRSFIVNSNFIKQVNSASLMLINKEQIPLSRSYKNKF